MNDSRKSDFIKISMAAGLLMSTTACSFSSKNVHIPMQVPSRMGMSMNDIAIPGFEAQPDSLDEAQQLAGLVIAKIGAEQYMTVNPNSINTLKGQIFTANYSYDTSSKDRYKLKKVNGKPKLVKDGLDCIVVKKSSVVGSFSVVGRYGQNYGGESISLPIEQEGVGESCASAKAELLTDEQLTQDALNTIATQIVHAISPHTISVKTRLMTGKSKDNKLGIDYFNDGLKEQAVAIWNQVAEHSEKVSSRAAAHHNIGVAHESVGDLRDAFDSFSEASALDPREELHRKALARIVERQRNSDQI